MAMKFPKQLFVKIEDGGDGLDWFSANKDIACVVETGERAKIAIYQLVETVEAEGLVKTKPIGKRRR